MGDHKTYIVLLRGINVSGQKKIKMADLRALLSGAGFEDVQTYIQSGNIILKSAMDASAISDRVKYLIEQEYGWDVPVLTRSTEEWSQTIDTNPFLDREEGKLCVALLTERPSTERIDQLEESDFGNEEFSINGRDVFIHAPDGFARAKLNNNLLERKLNVKATTRNWRTMKKLLELASRDD